MKKFVATFSIFAALACAAPAIADQNVTVDPAWQAVGQEPAPVQQAPAAVAPGNNTDLGAIRGRVQVNTDTTSPRARPIYQQRQIERNRIRNQQNQMMQNNQMNDPAQNNVFRKMDNRMERDNWRDDRRRFRDRDRDFEAGAAAIGLFTTIIQNQERRKHHREMRREMREQRMMDQGGRGTYRCQVYDADSGRYVSGTCWGKPRR